MRALLAQVSVRIRAGVPRRDSELEIFHGYLAWVRAGAETLEHSNLYTILHISGFTFPYFPFLFLSSYSTPTNPPTLVSEPGRSYSRFSDAIVYVALLSHTLVIQHRYPLSIVAILLHLVFQL